MNRWFYTAIAAILLGGAAVVYIFRDDFGLGSKPSPVGSATAQPDAASRAEEMEWTEVDRSTDGFKLQMPAGYKETKVPAYDEKDNAELVSMLYSYPEADTSFSLSWDDNPPVERSSGEDPQRTLDNARDGALARTQTVLVDEQKSVRQGFAVRDFNGRNAGGGVFNARFILAGKRLYMLMVSYPAVGARKESDVNRFYDSFTVVTPTVPH